MASEPTADELRDSAEMLRHRERIYWRSAAYLASATLLLLALALALGGDPPARAVLLLAATAVAALSARVLERHGRFLARAWAEYWTARGRKKEKASQPDEGKSLRDLLVRAAVVAAFLLFLATEFAALAAFGAAPALVGGFAIGQVALVVLATAAAFARRWLAGRTGPA